MSLQTLAHDTYEKLFAEHRLVVEELLSFGQLDSRQRGYERAGCDRSSRLSAASNITPAPCFEVELTFPIEGEDGSPRFGSVGGGGRYDGLVSRFRGEPVPATGFSIGVSRLAAALNISASSM